jgi:hypothetical protein
LEFDTWPSSGCGFSRIKLLDTYRDITFETLGDSDRCLHGRFVKIGSDANRCNGLIWLNEWLVTWRGYFSVPMHSKLIR